MKLLVDMGNSRLKSAVMTSKAELSQFKAEAYGGQKPIAALISLLGQYPEIESVTLVSVLGHEFQEQAESLLKQRKTTLCWVASEQEAKGVINHYGQPEQLGSDRFVALVAARHAFPQQSCIVIDCGTAVTIDALSVKGEFLGGVIIPGLRLWSDSLIARAGQLNEHQIENTNLFARDTAQAIGSGSIFGLTSAIEGVCNRMAQKIQQESQGCSASKLVICGGDAKLICEYSQLEFELIPNLVLIGLAEYT